MMTFNLNYLKVTDRNSKTGLYRNRQNCIFIRFGQVIPFVYCVISVDAKKASLAWHRSKGGLTAKDTDIDSLKKTVTCLFLSRKIWLN